MELAKTRTIRHFRYGVFTPFKRGSGVRGECAKGRSQPRAAAVESERLERRQFPLPAPRKPSFPPACANGLRRKGAKAPPEPATRVS